MPLNLDEMDPPQLEAYARDQSVLARHGDAPSRWRAAYAAQRAKLLHAEAMGYAALASAYRADCDAIKRKLSLPDRWY